jgi:hypothetical protein
MKDLELANILAQTSKELSTEIRPIPSFNNDYFASSHGQIYTFKQRRLRALSQCVHYKGYRFVRLYRAGTGHDFKVHRLVMWSFVGQSEMEVNHLNGVKTDNRLENLEYCTASENARHAYEMGLRQNFCGQPSGKDHWTKKQKTILRKRAEVAL